MADLSAMEPQPRRLQDSAPAHPGTRHAWPPTALRPSKKRLDEVCYASCDLRSDSCHVPLQSRGRARLLSDVWWSISGRCGRSSGSDLMARGFLERSPPPPPQLRNGILIQAVGIPLRHLLAFYGLRLCLGGQVHQEEELDTYTSLVCGSTLLVFSVLFCPFARCLGAQAFLLWLCGPLAASASRPAHTDCGLPRLVHLEPSAFEL